MWLRFLVPRGPQPKRRLNNKGLPSQFMARDEEMFRLNTGLMVLPASRVHSEFARSGGNNTVGDDPNSFSANLVFRAYLSLNPERRLP